MEHGWLREVLKGDQKVGVQCKNQITTGGRLCSREEASGREKGACREGGGWGERIKKY
jgi:hypothetical protein